MVIAGLVKSSLIDFPGKVAAVIFTPGCSFRCPWCHNPELALQPAQSIPKYTVEEVLNFLKTRRGLLGGVVLTGGEPTLQAGLTDFCLTLRGLGFAIKLDTNGSRPKVLTALLKAGLLDMVALDVKGPPELYPELSGLSQEALALEDIEDSMHVLAHWSRDKANTFSCEYRTTIMQPQLDESAIRRLAGWIPAGVDWRLQAFTPRHGMLDPNFVAYEPTPAQIAGLQALADSLRTPVGDKNYSL
jgi:pyruvate formate lyase activating enzyme